MVRQGRHASTSVTAACGTSYRLTAATWALAYWALLLVTCWRLGKRVWQGGRRWVMVLLGLLGGVLLTVAGTLGGHLAGNPSGVSRLLRLAGWEVYTTFYVPNFMLTLLVVIALTLAVLGLVGRRRGR